jgi:hypothetical protein
VRAEVISSALTLLCEAQVFHELEPALIQVVASMKYCPSRPLSTAEFVTTAMLEICDMMCESVRLNAESPHVDNSKGTSTFFSATKYQELAKSQVSFPGWVQDSSIAWLHDAMLPTVRQEKIGGLLSSLGFSFVDGMVS